MEKTRRELQLKYVKEVGYIIVISLVLLRVRICHKVKDFGRHINLIFSVYITPRSFIA